MRNYRRIYFLIIFSTFFLSANGQDATKEVAKQLVEIANDAYFDLKMTLIANEQYVLAADRDQYNIEAHYMAGKTFLETNHKQKATKYLLRVLELDPNYKFNLHFLIGKAYQYALQFGKAFDHYDRYLIQLEQSGKMSGPDFTQESEVERKIFECQNGLEYLSFPRDYVIENVGPEINSEWDDYGPVLTADEKFIVFTTRRQEGNPNMYVFDNLRSYENVFYSTKSRDRWLPAENIGLPINDKYHSSNLAISADGSQLYLYKSENGGDIFLSEKNPNGTWTEPEPLNDNINTPFSEKSISISPDGNTLYFSSDRPISQNKKGLDIYYLQENSKFSVDRHLPPNRKDLDLYYSKKNSTGEWGPAVYISELNTEYDEDGVFIGYDGMTLYFSSKGHRGMGGYDIYRSLYDEEHGVWSYPINLGYPMNSPDNDIYFVSTRDGKRGYYASSKTDGYGFMDIYHIELADLDLPPKIVEENIPIEFLIKTVDKESNKAIEADISIEEANTNFPVFVNRIEEGHYQVQFTNESTTKYNIRIEKPGYMYQNSSISIPGMTTSENKISRQIELDKIKAGFSTVIRNIYFDFGTARLKDSSTPELQKLLKVMQENPAYLIEVSGHTDNIGGKKFNQWLSERRAQAIVTYMVNRGERQERFIVKGYGEGLPVASNDDEELGRQLNRRVEFKVLRFLNGPSL